MTTVYNKQHKIFTDKASNELLSQCNSINWNKLTPSKDCKNCDTWSEYICFECEDIFMKKNYPNYFYNDDCEWELKDGCN